MTMTQGKAKNRQVLLTELEIWLCKYKNIFNGNKYLGLSVLLHVVEQLEHASPKHSNPLCEYPVPLG